MNIEKFTEDVNVHQSLEDQPSLSALELKKKWDEPANKIKEYLNGILIKSIEDEVPKEIKEQIDEAIKKLKDLLDQYSEKLDEALKEFEDKMKKFENMINSNSSYKDFEVTTNNSVVLTTSVQYGEYKVSKSATFNKPGYKPIGIVGYNVPFNYNQRWEIRQCYLESVSNGSVKVYIEGNPTTNNGNINYTTTVNVHILWVKIK